MAKLPDDWGMLQCTSNPAILEAMIARGTCTEAARPYRYLPPDDRMALCGAKAGWQVSGGSGGSRWVTCTACKDILIRNAYFTAAPLPAIASASGKCTCPISMLMRSGCACGGK